MSTKPIAVILSRDVARVTWTGLRAGESGGSEAVHGFGGVQFTLDGRFHRAAVVLEGSNDGGNGWFPLTSGGERLKLCSPTAVLIDSLPLLMRPRIDGGGDKTAITVTLTATRRS